MTVLNAVTAAVAVNNPIDTLRSEVFFSKRTYKQAIVAYQQTCC
jgi:hypothetical protein